MHCERLKAHGAIRAVEWASAEHGALFACAASDGTVTVVGHLGSLVDDAGEVAHQWNSRTFAAHSHSADAVSWASPPSIGEGPLSLRGARLAVAGGDGLSIWCWSSGRSEWEAEAMGQGPAAQAPARDVAWKPWDGITETVATAAGTVVTLWYYEETEGSVPCWRVQQQVD